MLSNLVPGLRDIRTPIVVGALWGVVLWVFAHWQLAPEAQAVSAFFADSPILRWKDHLVLGVVGGFIAYVLGVATTLDPERGLTGAAIARWDARRADAKAFDAQSRLLINDARELFEQAQAHSSKREKFDSLAAACKYSDYGTLKTRLMDGNQDLYLTCDKLDAEAALRMTSAVPLVVAAVLAWQWLDEPLFVVGGFVGVVLFIRGVGRAVEARDTARMAVVANLVEHPLRKLVSSLAARGSAAAADHDAEAKGVS